MIVYNFYFIIDKFYFATISQGVQSLVYVCVFASVEFQLIRHNIL